MENQAEEVGKAVRSAWPRLSAGHVAVLLALAGIAFLPTVVPAYRTLFLVFLFMNVILASSWNLVSGFTGYTSFGHVAFFGVGAYTAAILITEYAFPWFVAPVLGGVVATGVALLLGVVLLRLKGPYFAIATLGLAEVMRVLAAAWVSVTGGGSGYYLPPQVNTISVYYLMGFLMVLIIIITRAIARSDFGLRLLSIREDEGAAEVMGIDTTRHKIAAYMLSAFFPGVVGGLYAWQLSYIDPFSVFRAHLSVNMVIMTMFGGMGTVLGPIIGGVTLTVLAELFWARLPELHQAASGILIVVVVLLIPGGIMSLLRRRGIVPAARGW